MSEQPKMPVLTISPEKVRRINESTRVMFEQLRNAADAFGRAYAEALPGVRERLAAIQPPTLPRRD